MATLTLNTYAPQAVRQGLSRMGSDHEHLRQVPGLQFYRLLGTGRGSTLTLSADLRRWARFAVWSSADALEAFEASGWRAQERAGAAESCTAVLRPLRWRGRWGGAEPFEGPPARTADPGGPVAVLTRAAIRPTRLLRFWRAVPASQRHLDSQPGLLAAVGIGEVPLVHQATFSVWRSAQAMKAFAYGGAAHREVIARTHREGWYSEELFARFAVLDIRGRWGGRDLLGESGLAAPPTHL
ncbi:spheroidene monooxygenase [Deinococcus arcticus]|uniref:Spheroidene monooxygenase n=1 Tax=Deinococcus arcticus TaxID=2136176 RepID=A0A2T3WAE5_9DEIO|nr:spheroidene monooxygenase [Deinococcus arcticus]